MSEKTAAEIRAEERSIPEPPHGERRLSVVQQADNEALSNYRLSTSVAALCKELAEKTAVEISGRKYVPVATMAAIATAHGCVVGTRDVEKTATGFKCVAELREAKSSRIIATAEGFVGEDEEVWFGGEKEVWDKRQRKMVKKTYETRPEFAIRAMTQTRAAGRVCKLVFSHVIVLMNAGLETSPLEEAIDAEIIAEGTAQESGYDGEPVTDWRNVHIHMPWSKRHGPGCDKEHPGGMQLGELSKEALSWYQTKFEPDPKEPKDIRLRRALDISLGRVEPDVKAPADEIPA